MAQFRKGSLKERLYNSILKSAMGTLIKADTFHNFVMPGSTADNLIVTAAGGPIVESIKSGVSDVAGSIINTIVGDPGSLDMKDELILYNNDGEGTYRVSLKTIAGLIAAEAVQNASGDGGILTATSLWSLLMADSDYQIDISHMRDALKNYLTKEDVQGLFRSGGHNDYISKIFDDEALGLITFLSGLRSNGVAYLMKGLQIGKFQAGITGFGAKVDGYGNGEFESLIVRRFLEVPELRFNRVEILAGDSWRAPGGGIIESVTINSDGLTGKATLKLEEGEIGNIAVNDICMGIFHDYDNTNVNATETTDDGFGNRTFAGFCTAYFRVTSVDAVTEVDGIKYYNKTFNYAIRPTSSRWNRQMHPCQFMTFVAYGNFTNTQRQNATYETPAYTRMLRGQNSWEIQFSNIGMQFGDCGILSNFDTPGNPNPRAREASTFLFYIDGDIMHTGVLRRVDPHGRDIVDYYDQGEWDPLTEYFYKDRVSHNGSLWLCVHEDTIDEHGVIHGLIGDEPAPGNPNWLALVYADSIVSMGHWRAEECPYRAQTIVNLGGILYLSKVETSNPPRGLLTGRQNDGNTYYLKDNQGMYLMTNDNTISDDWDLLIDISESVMGEDAIYINLTNDSDSIESDENGVIPAGAEYPTTKAQLYKGSTQITSGITWAVSAVGCSATIAPESGVVATSAMTADKATVTIYATYNNVTYTKIFTFGKLFGANKLILSPSADVIKYDPNTQTFEPEILVMRAYMVKNGERTEITSTNNLGYIYLNGNTAQKYYSGMSVNTNDLQAFANGRLKFELFDSQDHIGDMEEVPLVQDGIDGAGNVVINLTNDSDSIVTDSDGNIDPNETYPTTTAELFVDMEKIPDTDVTWNCAGSGCQAVIDEHGVVTTSNMTADVATVTIIGTYVANGRSYYKVFKFRKLFGAEKYYLQCSHNVIIRDQNGAYTPNSITVRAYCKKFGEDPIECTQAANIGKIVYAGQVEPQFSPVVHVITGSSFTDRHLVFTLIDNNNNIQDTEDIPLVWDGKDGRDGEDGKGFANKGHWDSEEEYVEGDVVQLGNQYFSCIIPNHGKPPRAILCDSVSGKYLTNEDGGYFPVGEEFDDTYWEPFFRDGRDGIDGVDGRDGRDGQDGDTPVFINLTNDSDSVVTDSDGNPLEGLPTTVAQFFYGSQQLFSSDGVVWGTDHVVGCQVNFNQDGEYEITSMSADRAQVVIKATYNGVFYLRTFSFVKLYGQDKYVVEPEVGTVQYNPENGTFTPTRLALYAYVIKNGQFQSVTRESDLGYIKVGDSATRRYNGDEIVTADFFSVSGVEVSLIDNDGNVKDKEYIPRVSDGRNGQPGSDAIMIQFDDSNVHFLCDADGVPVAGQAYTVNSSLYIGSSLSPLKSMEETGGCSVASNMVGDRPAISFTAQITGTHNDNLQIAINGFDTNAPDNNKLTVTLVSENGQHTRIGVISVDKVRPGKDGESPIVYNVVPGVNTIKKNGSAYAPTVLTAAVRKSHVDNGAIYNDMLDPLDAFTYEGIKIYYALDKVMTSPAMADGEVPDAGITLAANSVQQYIHLAIAKANGQFLDTQSVAILQDGTSPIMADLDNEMDSVACDVDMHPDRAQRVSTNVELFNGSRKHLIDRIKIKKGTDVVYDSGSGSTIVPITGVTFTVAIGQSNGAAIQIDFGTTATLDEHTNYEIELYGTVNSQEVVRSLTLTINGVRPGIDGSPASIFQLVPSAGSISKYKNDTYSESELTCAYTKNVGGEYVTPEGGTIKMKIDSSNNEVNYRALTPGTDFNDKVLYILRVGDSIVDKETVLIVSDGTDGIDGKSSYKSTMFVRMNDTPNKPANNAGSYANPAPSSQLAGRNSDNVQVYWSDGIPEGTNKVWQTTRIFSSDGNAPQQATWTTPRPITETSTYQIRFSDVAENPGDPTTNPSKWHAPGEAGIDYTNMIWMAERNCDNGVWTSWVIVKIKGEKGEDGTSIVNMGHWHSGVDYPLGAWVEFMGAIYRCIQACGNIPPKVCLTDGEHFLVNKGYYIVACPEVANSAYWVEDVPAYPDVARLDLDNENDSILYDGDGNKISASPVSHASLYVNGEEMLDNITLTANWVNCSGTVSGKTITVNDVTGDSGYVEVSTVFNGATYRARMNVIRIAGTDKYDIILSHKSVHVDTNITPNTYIPSAVTVNVLVTKQNQEPRLVTRAEAAAANLDLTYRHGSNPPVTMAVGDSIPKAVFEQSSSVIVTLEKDDVIIDQETIPVVKDGVNGTSPIVADLDNEMDSIACDVNMHPSPDDQTVITHVVMLHGSAPQSIKSLKLYKNNTEVITGGGISVNITGVNTTEGTITMVFSEEATLEDVNNYEIRVVSTINAVDERRSLNFVINGIRPGADGAPAAVYNLQPSKSQIVKRKNGSYSVASLNCTYSKVVGGNAVEPATGGTIKAILDNSGTEVTNRAFVPGTDFNSEVLYLLYVGGRVVDKESVPIVEDGEDGEDGKGFVDCGDWDSETEYNPGDVVHFAGEMLICLHTTRNAPYGLLKGRVGGNDPKFLKDANGGYIIVDDSELTDDWGMFMASPDPTCRIDLDNENDSILYDNVGRNISGSCISNISFYIGYQKFTEKVTFNITPNGCTATLSDNKIEVSDVSGDVGTVTVTCVYNGETYQAIMTVKRLVGVNKYDIRLSASSLQYNPDTQRYSDTGVTVDVIRTSQKDSKIVLNADAFTSGPEAGYVLRWKKASDANYTNINPRTVIANTDFNKEDVYVELLDNTGLVLDAETIPFISAGGSSFRIDLSNENDSILYDNVGRNISGSVSTAVNLYLGNQHYNDQVQFTYAATGCTASLSGNVITVSNVNDGVDVGQVVVSAVFQGNTYTAVMSVKRLVGVNKYDLQFSASEMSYDTDNKTYANSSIMVDVIRTSAKDGRTRLTSSAFDTGKPEAGYVLRYFTADDLTTPAGTINPRGTIPSSAWANGDVLVQLLDASNFVLDSETIPLVKSGSSVLRLDLNNEHDSILYDNNGKKVSGNVSTKATLYKGAAPYSGALTYTAVATDCTITNASTSSSTGNVTVTGISAGKTSGKVVISCVLDGVTYSATFTVTKLTGMNKYDLVLSASEMKRDPNNSNAYDPSGGITVDVYKTNQEGTRTRLASGAFNSGNDEAGYSLTYTTAGGSETVLNPRSTIPASAFSGGDVLVTLKDNNSKILDTESIPLLIQGLNGPGAQYIMIKGGCHAEDGYTPLNSGGSITVYDGKNTTTLTDTDMAADATTGKRRGLALVLVKRDTLAMSHKKFYDVYDPTYGNTRCNELANQIHNATNEYFIAIFSYDAIGFNTDLIIRLREAGSVGLHWYGPDRRPFSFLGYNGLPEGNALQNLGEKESHATADVMTYITNGSFGANPDAVRYYIETNPSALIKTSGNTWVSSGNITIKVYKQKGSQDPIQAVQGDIFARYVTDTGVEGQITIQSGTGTGTIAVNTLSASIKYITIYIAHENSNSANRLDSVTIPVIANGAPGYEGCQVRVTKWEDKAQNPNRLTFHNDRGTNGAFKIVDVIGVPWKQGIKDMVTGNTISEKPSSGYLWYLCEVGHNQVDTYEQERTSHGGSSGKWSAMSDLGPTFVTLLVAQYAKIEFGTTNEFLFVNSRDEVVGGFSGTIDNENEDNSIRIWAGRALPTESWSYTMPSHVTGKYLWGRLEVYKGNSTTVSETIRVMPTVLCSAASSYYTVNTAYNFQQPTIDTPPTSWTNWDKNAECTPPSRPSGFHLWVRVQVYSSSSTIMATYYFRVRLNAQSIHSWRMQFVNSDVNGNEPSLAPFRVTHGGELYAKHAHIEGEVIATSGTFTNGTFVSCTIQSATITGGTWNTASITNVTINTATINNVTITNADVTGRITGSLRNPFMTVYDSFSAYDKDNLAMMTTASSWADVTLFSIPWDASQSGRLLRLCSYYWNGKDFPTEGWGRIQAPSGKYFYENGRKFKNLYFSREVVEIIGYGTSDTFYGWIVLNRTDIMTEKAYGMKNHCIAMGRVNGRTSTDTTVTCSAYRFDKQADPSTTMNITKVAEGVYKLTIPSSWKLTTSTIQVQLTPIGMVKGRDDIYLQNVGVKEFETSGDYVTGIVMYCSDDNSPNDGDFYYAIYNMEQYLQYHASGG